MRALIVGYSLIEKNVGSPTRYMNRSVEGMLDNLVSIGDLERKLPALYAEIRALIEASAEQALRAADSEEGSPEPSRTS